MLGCSVNPHSIGARLGGAIAQGEEQLVVQIDVSETENRSHSGAQRFQLINDERKRNAVSL